MNSTELMKRFQRFASADLFPLPPNLAQQVSEVLLETHAVRIILTRHECRLEEIDVDIEISLQSIPSTSDAKSMQESIDGMIANLEYLKRLISIGFGLEAIEQEGILIASTVLNKETKEDVFIALEPPRRLFD